MSGSLNSVCLWRPIAQYSFVCEYARVCNPNIKIIASAGSPEKIKILKNVGVDVAFNYKEEDTEKVLRDHGPIDMCVSCLLWRQIYADISKLLGQRCRSYVGRRSGQHAQPRRNYRVRCPQRCQQ